MTRSNRTRLPYGYVIIAAALGIIIAQWALYYSFGVFFNAILKEFGWSRAATSSAFSIASLMSACAGFLMGSLIDRVGPRVVLTAAGVLLGSGYGLLSTMERLWEFYVYYGVLIGFGMGGAFVPLLTTAARWFVSRAGIVSGLISSGIGVGAFVGPLIISRLMIQHGWRMTLLMVGMVAMGIIVLGAQFLRSPSTDSGQVSSIVPNRSRLAEDASFKEALRSSAFWVVFLAYACCGFVVLAVIVHIIPYAIELEIGIPAASATLSVLAICSVLGKILMGMASDVIGNKKSCGIGFVLMGGSLLGMVCSETLNPLCGFAGLFGFAYGAIIASESPLIASLFGLKAHGSILGAVSTGYMSGGAVGPFLMGMLFDVTGAYGWGFLVLIMTAVLGMILTYRLFP